MIAFILGNFLRSLMSMMINKLVIKISHKNRKNLRPKVAWKGIYLLLTKTRKISSANHVKKHFHITQV